MFACMEENMERKYTRPLTWESWTVFLVTKNTNYFIITNIKLNPINKKGLWDNFKLSFNFLSLNLLICTTGKKNIPLDC